MTRCRKYERGQIWLSGPAVLCTLLVLFLPLAASGTPKPHRQSRLDSLPQAVDFDSLPATPYDQGGDNCNLDEVVSQIQNTVHYLKDASGNPSLLDPPDYDAIPRGNAGPDVVRYALTGWGTAIFYRWGHGWGNDTNGHGGGIKCGEGWLIAHRCANADNDPNPCRCHNAYLLPAYSNMSWSKCRLAVLGGCYTAYPLDSNDVPRDRQNDTEDGRHGNLTWELHNHGGIGTVLGFAGETLYADERCEIWATSFWQALCQPVRTGLTDGIPLSVYWAAWHAKQDVWDYHGYQSYEGYDTYKICGDSTLRIVPVY